MCYRKGPVSRPPGGGFRAQHTRGVSGGARAVENVPRGIPSSAPQSASRQHHRGSVWAIPGRSDGGTSDPCTQWTDLARFDERGGGIGASGPSSTPHYLLAMSHLVSFSDRLVCALHSSIHSRIGGGVTHCAYTRMPNRPHFPLISGVGPVFLLERY